MRKWASFKDLVVPVAAVGVLLGWQSIASAADVFYSGRAVGVSANLVIGTLTKKVLLAKNDMSCQGLPDEETISGIDNAAPLVIKAKTITTFTQGVDGVATASAALEDLRFEVPGLKITGGALDAFAETRCVNGKPQSSGNSNVGTVTVNGQTHVIGATPNQKVEVPGVATITFNKQTKYSREFKVYAVYIELFDDSHPVRGLAYMGEAKAKISSCAAVCTAP